MPELPEVETVMRGLENGHGRPPHRQGRARAATICAFPFRRILPSALTAAVSSAFGGGPNISSPISKAARCLLVHLGMSGRFAVVNGNGRMRNLGEFYFEEAASPKRPRPA